MGTCGRCSFVAAGIAVCAAMLCFSSERAAGETNAPPDSLSPWLNLAVQSVQQLNEQQQATQRAIAEAEAAAKRAADATEARLRAIEQAVNIQRDRELQAAQSAHRFTLLVIGLVAGIGFTGMFAMAFVFLRMMQRRAPVLPMTSPGFAAGPALLTAGSGDAQLMPSDPVAQSRAAFLDAIDRLERRVRELEGGATAGPVNPEPTQPKIVRDPVAPTPAPATGAGRAALLVGKGVTLLNLGQAEQALACFNEALAIDPVNTEALMKKGAALEQLTRYDEAVEQYDHAIAVDASLTMAYLRKGGVFNRLERYNDALDCYERALRANQKTRVP
jgi:tetratricopeptide (TPR) repeat protein